MLSLTDRYRSIEHIEHAIPDVVLSVQDTTTLNYSKKRSAEKLGVLQDPKQKGFYLHNHLLMDVNGIPIGLLNQFFWNRDPQTLGIRKASRKSLPIEEKESYRWVKEKQLLNEAFASQTRTKFVCIGDRESDIYELFSEPTAPHIHYLVRGRGDRIEMETGLPIRSMLSDMPRQGMAQIQIPDPKSILKTISVTLSIRYATICIRPKADTKSTKRRKPISLQVIWAQQVQSEELQLDEEPIDWLLFTSLPVQTMDDALMIIKYYKSRWRIEQFHYILKQGCQIENLQLEDPEALKNAIVTYSMVAVQVLRLQLLARQNPEQDLEQAGMDINAYRAGALFLQKKMNIDIDPDKKKPTISDFIRVVAIIGGSSLQKNRPIGSKIIWRGLRDLELITQAFVLFFNHNSS